MTKSIDLSDATALEPKKPVTVIHKLEEKLTGFQYYNFVWGGLAIGFFLLAGLTVLLLPVFGVVHGSEFPNHKMDDGWNTACFIFGGLILLVSLFVAGIWLYHLETERLSRHSIKVKNWRREDQQQVTNKWSTLDHGLPPAPGYRVGTMALGFDGFTYIWNGTDWERG